MKMMSPERLNCIIINFLKKQGLSVLNRVRSDLAKGHAPVVSIADSISLVVGGGLLLIPGYVTDGIGLLLFIPGFRTMAGMYLLQWVAKKPHFSGFVNFGGSTFARENSNQRPFGFSEQPRHQNDFDDVIDVAAIYKSKITFSEKYEHLWRTDGFVRIDQQPERPLAAGGARASTN